MSWLRSVKRQPRTAPADQTRSARWQRRAVSGDLLMFTRSQRFKDSWSVRDGEFADRINSMTKYVASRTLTETAWNATLIEGDVAEELARLKEQPGKDILKWGTGELDRTLVEHGLVDEFHFWYFPVILGSGKHLFEGAGFDTTHLKLADLNRFDSGIVVHIYVPK
jgi:dihydrofolate reductase